MSVSTFSDDNFIYSVDMMFVYLSRHNTAPVKLRVVELLHNLSYKVWDDNATGDLISPIDVLENSEKYKDHYDRIIKANLKYPIIIDKDKWVIDGAHRIAKCVMEGVTTIKAHVFDDNLKAKFRVCKITENIWDIRMCKFIELYLQRFE